METNNVYPFVSLCTPTFNRRPFIEIMFQCYRNQIYPKDRMEWIIIDDGTDKIEDLILSSNIDEIRYYKVNEKMSLSDKRNYMHTFIKGDFVVYIDDDDYYPPERVSHSIETLLNNPNALCAGASEIYVYFNNIKKMVQFGPYNINHATAGTFAFRKELLSLTKYESNKEFSEEESFLQSYTIPFVQLNPLKTILVFAHQHNTVDKYDVYKMGGLYVKDSDKIIEMFIKNENEDDIKDFFINKLEKILVDYSIGSVENKPETLKQRINEKIKLDDFLSKPLVYVNEDKSVSNLSKLDIINIINQQKNNIFELTKIINEYEKNKLFFKDSESEKNIELKSADIINIINSQQSNILKLNETNQKLLEELNNLTLEYNKLKYSNEKN